MPGKTDEERMIMDRRQFLQSSGAVGTLASGLSAGSDAAPQQRTVQPAESQQAESQRNVGRPVRAVSIAFRPGLPLERIAELVDQEGARGADIVTLPETCRGQDDKSRENLDGPTISAMAALAKKHRTYIACPIDREDGGRRFNSVVLLDRRGNVAFLYDKMYPVWQEECLKTPAVRPGESVAVHSADFGRVGFAICFDVNWAPVWQRLSDLGAELVIWPSAYSAGKSLQARAVNYNYYVLSATWTPDCLIFDIDGDEIAHDSNNRGNGTNITRATLDLDRCIFHQDLNLPDKLDKLLKEKGEDVVREKWLPMEGWFVLKARRPGPSARELARQYGLEELRHYINRSRCEIDKSRGFVFS
ncbi:MAG: carbon-nitrogen hydrolase family protein [Bryobacteraceae bacterium]